MKFHPFLGVFAPEHGGSLFVHRAEYFRHHLDHLYFYSHAGKERGELDPDDTAAYDGKFFRKFFAVECFPRSPVICIRKSLDWRDYRFGAGTEEDIFDGEKVVSAV